MQFHSHGDYGVPTFVFDPAQIAGSFGGNAGFGFASFLLGNANQGSVSTLNNTYGRRKTLSLYALDDFKVTSKLTMNFDLRWDFNGRYHEKYGSFVKSPEVLLLTGPLLGFFGHGFFSVFGAMLAELFPSAYAPPHTDCATAPGEGSAPWRRLRSGR